ncbi:FAD-dependent oxidoreductase [Paenibacillus sp. GYB006]|uniref:FAD-dependent oxidoreductase n=1 Tax=Paenibacillus sp. GYB006 TaxID=2994394 RepID=UPI002F9619DA
MKKQLVVIGNGMSGMKCIEEILKINKDRFEISVLGDEPRPNYNRIELSKVLQGGTSFDDIILHDWAWYEENGIHLYTGERVTRIRRKDKWIETNSGRKVRYDVLLIATGSSAFIPPIPGSDQEGVITFRSVDDCMIMMDYAKKYKKAIVIGGGLLGLEAARGLLHLGMETEVIHNAAYLMNRQLDSMSAELLQVELEAQGMKFRLGQQTVQILGSNRAKGIRLANGSKLDADLIVFAVGIRPNVELAKDSGLKTGRGIIVDDYLQTSDTDVYAVGECAEHQGICYGLVAPLYEQASILARTLCQHEIEPYRGSIPYSRLKVSGVNLFSVGEIGPDIPIALQEYDRLNYKYKKVTMKDGRVKGAILYGDTTDSPILLDYISRQVSTEELIQLTVTPKSENKMEALMEAMPPSDTVCGCNQVSKLAIMKSVQTDGLTTADQIKQKTKASGSCGGCRPMVEALVKVILSSDAENRGMKDQEKETLSVCPCMSLGHEELKQYIRSLREAREISFETITPSEIRKLLGLEKENGCATCNAAITFYIKTSQMQSAPSPWSNDFKAYLAWCENLFLPHSIQAAATEQKDSIFGILLYDIAIQACPAGYEVFIGGHAEHPVKQGLLVWLSSTKEEAIEVAVACVRLYQKEAWFNEKTWEWTERIGIMNLREQVMVQLGIASEMINMNEAYFS